MRKEFRIRYTIIGILFAFIMLLLAIQLFNLQFVHGEDYLTKAQNFSQRNIRVTGPRGKILDANGLPLAYNQMSYSVQFVRNPSLDTKDGRSQYTQALIKAMNIIDQNNGKFLSTFAIQKLDDGSYDFEWSGIDKVTDKKVYDARVKDWKNSNCKGIIKSADSPAQIFQECRDYYYIPADTSYDDAYKILSVWQEVRSTYFASYMPITLADDVDMNTVAQIEMDSTELPGMQISQSSTRVYPNKTMAAHIIGYMGRMLDEPTMVAMKKLGYQQDDLIGVAGIEASEEVELSGNTTERTGTQVIEVDNLGKIAREISSNNKDPKPGNNVMLTIDSGLQKITEEALQENIAQVKATQQAVFQANQNKYNLALQGLKQKDINYASVGAAVVMQVQTGDILAMASNPSFDPNVFTGGLSQADYDKYFVGTKENPMNNPLFDNAISSRGTPGSVFKMCTGLAGLMEGKLGLTEQISDKGTYDNYTKPGQGPKCWAFGTASISKHQDQTIVEGLSNSCDYFFYTVADRLGINLLDKWADALGLTSKTNVQLPSEVAGQVSSQQTLYSPGYMSGVAALVRNKIVQLMTTECTSLHMTYDSDVYTNAALKMMNLVNQTPTNMGPDIRAILKNDLQLTSAEIVSSNLSNEISLTLTEIIWQPNFTLEAGIGQSVTTLTPIGMARYVSALVNGGNVYEANLIKSIITPDGAQHPQSPTLVRSLDIPAEYLQKIKTGMQHVVDSEHGGTAGDVFKNFKYKDQVGGKTGTAQVNAAIDLENNSWFVAFAPYDKPEIAVVVYIPHGYEGSLSSYTAQQIIQYYLDKENQPSTVTNLPQVNMLVK